MISAFREDREERAAIMEFDGGLSRAEANRKALSPGINGATAAHVSGVGGIRPRLEWIGGIESRNRCHALTDRLN